MRETFTYKSRQQTFLENLGAMVIGCFFLALPFLLPMFAAAVGIGAGHACHKAQICTDQGVVNHGNKEIK